jgi:hypothetical protein
LPLRAQYNEASTVPSIGVNSVEVDRGLWYAGPDLVASVLLAGKAPNVRRAIRIVPKGQQDGLTPVKLQGVEIDPRRDDFFRRVI